MYLNRLVVLVVILALANLGTSFASAILAKDTTTNTNGELIDKRTNEAVATAKQSRNLRSNRKRTRVEGSCALQLARAIISSITVMLTMPSSPRLTLRWQKRYWKNVPRILSG